MSIAKDLSEDIAIKSARFVIKFPSYSSCPVHTTTSIILRDVPSAISFARGENCAGEFHNGQLFRLIPRCITCNTMFDCKSLLKNSAFSFCISSIA